MRTVLATGERLAIDFRFTTPEGPRWFSARLLPEQEADRRGERVILACTDVTDRVNREAEQAALRRVATVVAREADLEEIGRVVAQEAALLLNASGSAVYRFESEERGHLRRGPPARPPRDSAVTRRSRSPPRRRPDARPAPARRPASRTTARRRSTPRCARCSTPACAAASPRPLWTRGPAVGGPDGRLLARPRLRPGRGAAPGRLRRARRDRRRQRRDARRSSTAWPTPTRSPASPTGGR